MKTLILSLFLILFCCSSLQAQQPADSTLAQPAWPRPGRAVAYSLVLPGLGQFYNKDYWKVPVVWGAVGAAGYFLVYNHNEFTKYRDLARNEDDPLRVQYRSLRDYHRRNRDLTILLTGLGYALVAVEAYVDAHLYHFDVSDNLSMSFYPTLLPTGHSVQPALGISLRIK